MNIARVIFQNRKCKHVASQAEWRTKVQQKTNIQFFYIKELFSTALLNSIVR